MSRYYFEFNGLSSLSYGIYIVSKQIHDMPSRSVEKYTIPGRNGSVLLDNGNYNDVTVTYECAVVGTLNTQLNSIRAWLGASLGKYCVLSDNYRTDGYRRAAILDTISVTDQLNKIANFTITFTCRPQFYLTAGSTAQTLTLGNARDIYNSSAVGGDVTAKITVTSGDEASITVNGTTMTFDGIDGYVEIDFERRMIHKDGTPCPTVMTTTDFPTIGSHFNITASSGTGSIAVTPNWWTL